MRHICPACGSAFESKTKALTVCGRCQAARLRALAELEGRFPSAESLGLAGSSEPLRTLINRPHANGRRIIRKAEPMGG